MDSSEVRYPDVTAQLTGEDSNVFIIIGLVSRAIRGKHGADAAQEWSREAMSQDSYHAVLGLAMRTVNVK